MAEYSNANEEEKAITDDIILNEITDKLIGASTKENKEAFLMSLNKYMHMFRSDIEMRIRNGSKRPQEEMIILLHAAYFNNRKKS